MNINARMCLMRRSRLPLVIVFVVVLTACSAEMSLRQRSEAEQAVNARLNSWVRAINNAEMDTLYLMHHRVSELTVIMGDGREAHGWDEEEDLYRSFFDGVERVNLVMQREEVEILNTELAITTFRHSMDIMLPDEERRPPVAGHGTIIWVKDSRDDQWKIHLSHMSYRPPSEN
jgi:ketosteroid isomerase-like protein